jgi:lipoyl(octanoyl) transferase
MIKVIDLGLIDYRKAHDIQLNLRDRIISGQENDTLLLLEHPPVLTMGKRGINENIMLSPEYLKKQGIDVIEIERGGDVTYHGPGQLVGYPLLNLTQYGQDLHLFVDRLEEIFVRLLAQDYGIEANREKGKYTGVYVGQDKLTAIGIAVKKWVSYHGFACNVSTNLEHFNWIVPCGLADRGVTSLEKLSGEMPDMGQVKSRVIELFGQIFDTSMEAGSLDKD